MNIHLLEFQLGCNILDALGLVERLAENESRNLELWHQQNYARPRNEDLQHAIRRVHMNRCEDSGQYLISPPHPEISREDVQRLGRSFSRCPSNLNPVVQQVWNTLCPSLLVSSC